MLRHAFFVTLLITQGAPMAGQAADDFFAKTSAGRMAVATEYVDQAKSIIRRNLQATTPWTIGTFDSIKVHIVDQIRPQAYAYIENDNRHIVISTAFLTLSNLYVTHMMINRYASVFDRRRCDRFVEESVRIMHTLPAPEAVNHPIMSPFKYCGVTDFQLSEQQYNEIFNAFFSEFFKSVTTIILGHEYAHHILNHLPLDPKTPPAERRKLEHIADQAGSYLFGESGTRIPAAIMFHMLSKFQNPKDPFRIDANYAAHQCRLLFFVYHDRMFSSGLNDTELQSFKAETPHFKAILEDAQTKLSAPLDKLPSCRELTLSDEELFGHPPK